MKNAAEWCQRIGSLVSDQMPCHNGPTNNDGKMRFCFWRLECVLTSDGDLTHKRDEKKESSRGSSFV